LKRKNAVRENTVGGIVTYNLLEGSQAGVTVNRVQYNHWLIPTLYNFGNTKEKIISSAWTVLNFSTISIFSEFASNDAERFSTISGITYQPVREFAVALSRRSYSQGYTSPFSRPFGVRSDISDGERGAYLGIELRPVRGLYFSAYYDSYELPDRLAFGSTGREMFVHSLLSSFRSWTLYFHLRNKIRNQLSIYEFDDVRNQNNYRFQFAYKISPAFTLTQRLEIVTVDYSPSRYHEKGYLIFSEAAYRKTNSPFTGKFRFVIYDTESYDSRIYQYESDVQGNFSNPPLYGKGMRWYFLAGYKMFEVFQFSIKYSETLRFNVLSMGSGNDVINGNLDNQLAVQLDVRL
ncbi:MAG: hypothetical protein H3C35_05505, partial [Bacteroidetes bacterium]|nr:hypothetical protein [Bacteroidota bacterium]